MIKDFLIGIDIGTNSTRAIIYSLNGDKIGEGISSYEIIRRNPGWCEQKAEWWLNAVYESTRSAIKNSGISKDAIKAVGITHQRQSVIPVSKDFKPLYNGIMWNDTRTGYEASWAKKEFGDFPIYEKTGFAPGGWTAYKLLWLKNNEPEIFDKAHKFILCIDYVVWNLTGNLVTASGSNSMTGMLDLKNPIHWASDILHKFGIPEEKLVGNIVPGNTIAGKLDQKQAENMGLPKYTPIIVTAGDQQCGTLGVGVVNQEKVGINGGTSCTIETVTDKLPIDKKMRYFIEINTENKYAPENGIYSGGAALINWYRKNFGQPEENKALENGTPIWDEIYKTAKKEPNGNLGLLLIPYFSGTAAPYWDPFSRGILFGFIENHSRGNVVRAIVEGEAFESLRVIEAFEENFENEIEEIRMYGGSSQSDFWNQTFANIIGKPVVTTKDSETTALGAAISAARGIGLFSNPQEAVKEMVNVLDTFEPDMKSRSLYKSLYFEVYKPFYDRIHDLIGKLSAIINENENRQSS